MSKFESVNVLKSTILYSGPNRRLVADTVEFARMLQLCNIA